MQTFITYFSHVKTMADLDRARLGKQRVETKQILMSLNGESDGAWSNHPAVQMWAGYEPALILYGLICCHEWRIVRGHEDSLWGYFADAARQCGMVDVEKRLNAKGEVTGVYMDGNAPEEPPWLIDKWVVRSHRSNLMRKLPGWYVPKYDGTPGGPDLPYFWPVNDGKGGYTLRISKPDLTRLETGERWLPEGFGLDGLTIYPPED